MAAWFRNGKDAEVVSPAGNARPGHLLRRHRRRVEICAADILIPWFGTGFAKVRSDQIGLKMQ
jgi:hypothetical protein